MIYISHNLGLILETCDRITVMYSGEAVEVGTVGRGVRPDAPPLYARPVQLDPAARRRQERAPAGADPAASCRCRTSGRRAATSGRAATISCRAICDHGRSPMETVTGEPGHARALPALSRDRLGARPKPARKPAEPATLGPVGARGRRPEEVLRDPRQLADGDVQRRQGAHGQGQREARLRRARGARRWRSSASPAAASRPSPRC